MNGQPLDLHNLRSGDLVLVHLALKAEDRVPDALVVDLLPAGLELENQNLAQSAASLDNASSAVKGGASRCRTPAWCTRSTVMTVTLPRSSSTATAPPTCCTWRGRDPGHLPRPAAAGRVDVPAEPAGGGRWAGEMTVKAR
jgi:hypothetical protein